MSRKASQGWNGDFSVAPKLKMTKHAVQRCNERRISINDVLSQKPKRALLITHGKVVVTVLNKSELNSRRTDDGKPLFLSKVLCKQPDLVGRIIGSGGRNIKAVESIIPDTRISFHREDHCFHIWTTNQEGSRFLKEFLEKQVSLSSKHVAQYEKYCIEDLMLENFPQTTKFMIDQFGVEIAIYEQHVYFLGPEKALRRARNFWQTS